MIKIGDKMTLDQYWDSIHLQYDSAYDGWLDRYLSLFHKQDVIVELGSGRAYDSRYLLEKGFSNITACDFSKEVIAIIQKEVPSLKTLSFDMKGGLPFENNSIHVLIADLSIHYFDKDTTNFLVGEIYRVLKKDGKFIARVNSTNDSLYIPKTDEIEKNFFYNGNVYKRFFDKDSIKQFFKSFQFYSIEEKNVGKYEKPKVLWEFCVIKK